MAEKAQTEARSTTGKVRGPRDTEFLWREWAATAPEKGTSILFVHGIGEHSGRYESFGDYFSSRGVPVLSFDLRGHGHTGGPRGHIDRFDDYVGDVMHFRGFIAERHPKDKIVLVGHSLGGSIVLATAEAHSEAFVAVVASAPPLGLTLKIPGWKAVLGKLMSNLAPRFSQTNEIDPNHLARNPEVGRRYVADPIVHNKVTARWFVEVVGRAMGETMAGSARIAVPTLVMQGTDDRLVSAAATEVFARKPGGGPKEFRSYEGWYHELFQEDEREKAFADIWDWLAKQGLV